MESLLKNLINLLEDEKNLYQALLLLLHDEKEAVRLCRLDALDKTQTEKVSVLSRLTRLEDKRMALMTDLAAPGASLPQDFRLRNLVELIHEPYASQLKDLRTDLIVLLQKIQKVNETNMALFRQAYEFAKDSSILLHNLAVNNPVYYSSGKFPNKKLRGSLLSGEI